MRGEPVDEEAQTVDVDMGAVDHLLRDIGCWATGLRLCYSRPAILFDLLYRRAQRIIWMLRLRTDESSFENRFSMRDDQEHSTLTQELTTARQCASATHPAPNSSIRQRRLQLHKRAHFFGLETEPCHLTTTEHNKTWNIVPRTRHHRPQGSDYHLHWPPMRPHQTATSRSRHRLIKLVATAFQGSIRLTPPTTIHPP